MQVQMRWGPAECIMKLFLLSTFEPHLGFKKTCRPNIKTINLSLNYRKFSHNKNVIMICIDFLAVCETMI